MKKQIRSKSYLPNELMVIGIVAIVGVVIVEVAAIFHGVNGVALGASCATLGSIVGFAFKRR